MEQGGGEGGSREASQEAIAVIQARNNGLDQDNGDGAGQKWSDSTCILEIEPM